MVRRETTRKPVTSKPRTRTALTDAKKAASADPDADA
jgi:hypothetical protein